MFPNIDSSFTCRWVSVLTSCLRLGSEMEEESWLRKEREKICWQCWEEIPVGFELVGELSDVSIRLSP